MRGAPKTPRIPLYMRRGPHHRPYICKIGVFFALFRLFFDAINPSPPPIYGLGGWSCPKTPPLLPWMQNRFLCCPQNPISPSMNGLGPLLQTKLFLPRGAAGSSLFFSLLFFSLLLLLYIFYIIVFYIIVFVLALVGTSLHLPQLYPVCICPCWHQFAFAPIGNRGFAHFVRSLTLASLASGFYTLTKIYYIIIIYKVSEWTNGVSERVSEWTNGVSEREIGRASCRERV